MKNTILIILMLLVCTSCSISQKSNTNAIDTDNQEIASLNKNRLKPIPGYIVQELELIGGEILRPENWHYCAMYEKGTLAFQITKEDCSQGLGFETGLTINVIPGVTEKTRIKPSLYVDHFISKKQETAELLYREETRIFKHPDMVGELIRNGILVREKKKLLGKSHIFKIGYTIFAWDEADCFVIMIFGTPELEWDKYIDIYTTMTNDVLLIDRNRMDRNLQQLERN